VGLQVEYVRPETLRPDPSNPRRISQQGLRRLARLLDEHGFVDPIIARREDRLVIAGHQRLKANALRKSPDALVPVVCLGGIDDGRARALNVALNNPNAQGIFDETKLRQVLAGLADSALDLPAVTAYDEDELQALLKDVDEELAGVDLDSVGLDSAALAADGGDREPDSADVVLVFELSREQYRRAKADLDELIARHDLSCHVRFER